MVERKVEEYNKRKSMIPLIHLIYNGDITADRNGASLTG